MTQPVSKENKTKKAKVANRITIIALLIIFATPVLFAYGAFFFGWYDDQHTVNKGALIKPSIDRAVFDLTSLDGKVIDQKALISKWSLIYVNDAETCADVCTINLNLMRQVHTALGKNAIRRDDGRERLFRMLIVPTSTGQNFESFEDVTIVKGQFEMSSLKSGNHTLEAGFIYLADPLGNIIMKYGPYHSTDGISVKGKDLVKDIKKLLKYSRLG